MTSSGSSPRPPRRHRLERRSQSPPLRRVLVVEALRTWVVPAFGLAVAGTALALGLAGEILPAGSIAPLFGAGLLVASLYPALRERIFSPRPAERFASLAAAFAWAGLLLVFVYRHDNPGEPAWTGTLRVGQSSPALHLASHDEILVDARFVPAKEHVNRVARYLLEVVPEAGSPVPLSGTLDDEWRRARVGRGRRSGSTEVEVTRSSSSHHVVLDDDHPGRIRLASLDGPVEPDLRISAYAEWPPWLLPLAGAIGLLGALLQEKRAGSDGTLFVTLAASFSVTEAYVLWGSPRPEIRSLWGALMVGVIVGYGAGGALWSLVPARGRPSR